MNISEILKAKGIADDVIQGILADMKANKIYTASEENLDIRYNKLKTENEGKDQQLSEAQALIENLQKTTKGQEEAQQQIAAYKQQMEQLQQELQQAKFEAEAKYGLLAANIDDVDYGMYMLKEAMKKDGKELKVDENGKIPNWNDLLSSLQTQIPAHFETKADGDGYEIIEPNKLKKGDNGPGGVTHDQFRQMGYNERLALKQENEQLYRSLAKGN